MTHGATGQKVRRVVMVVLSAGAWVSAGSTSAFADMDLTPLSGQEQTDQAGKQNLSCGNSARLLRVNLVETVHQGKPCVDIDGHTRHHTTHHRGAHAVGATTLGPQTNIAQRGKQNLACGNSADLITVNVAGTLNQKTTCVAVDRGHHHGGSHGHGHGGHAHRGNASALGGTAIGPEVNAAQTGKQNVYCGNSADTLTVNVLGTIRKHTNCIAVDHSHGHGPEHRGRALADGGQVVGPETNTAQNGRQNQTCGNPGLGIDLPLGQTKRTARCGVHDDSATRNH
ncbi:hypothetical protein [Streptomyces sp. NPDC059008]|uniref:hypothetical protein n=1 Tax=Streptomyces sp. NPDC059008 TaxID=3346693 RepID=UPI00368CD749